MSLIHHQKINPEGIKGLLTKKCRTLQRPLEHCESKSRVMHGHGLNEQIILWDIYVLSTENNKSLLFLYNYGYLKGI